MSMCVWLTGALLCVYRDQSWPLIGQTLARVSSDWLLYTVTLPPGGTRDRDRHDSVMQTPKIKDGNGSV